ncbi:MAG: gas vesicle protein [Pseudomonadota bacterium]
MTRRPRSDPAGLRLDALLHPSPAETADFADPIAASAADRPSLVDVLDRLLDRGVVIHGDLKISVADVDLLYVGLSVVAASVDAIEDAKETLADAPGAASEPET